MKPSYRFGEFDLDGRGYRLTRGGSSIELPPKALDLLFLLAARSGALVSKDDILDALWPGVSVTDNAITQVVSELRQALGDSPGEPQFIQTVPRRGYRFIAEVAETAGGSGAEEHGGEATAVSSTPAPAHTRAAAPVRGAPDIAGLRRLAVTDFTNLSGESNLNWLAAGIAETMTHDLRAVRELAVIDRISAIDIDAERGAASGAPAPDLLVVGSVQQAGDRLRITARVVEAATRQAVAHARADGTMAELFDLQDAIVTQLSAGLQLTVTPAAAARMRARETSSLDAYRALTEGRLKLETLDPSAVPGAIADFERALALDPRYALAHIGLAHGCFWRFQASRATASPAIDQLAQAISHARRAVDLDPDLAEAHSALALFLSFTDRSPDAVAAGRLAVAIEPANWRHQFRYGIAAWGSERLEALGRVRDMFPPLAFTYFAAAMVHIARRDLDAADKALEIGIGFDAANDGTNARLPGNGLHWLRGLLRLSAGDDAAARAEFDRELGRASRGLFGMEYAMDACMGHGYAAIGRGDLDAAAHMFEQAIARFPEHARSWLGLADVRYRQSRRADTEAALSRGLDAVDALKSQGRTAEAGLASATAELIAGRPAGAVAMLDRLLADSTVASAGWTIPIEPAFAALANEPGFQTVLERLSARAE
ncbi:MAG TPA: winged helix-turn-helix domain-containing protein [Vicinamibacterales bacterium]|nr:winged helix-turn-helix domain-containing protein [Vicinamibacterales bacterium]